MRISKKLAAAAIAAGVALTASAAFAYWTASGSGGGAGAVKSTNTDTVNLIAAVPSGSIVPGGSVSVPVSATTSGDTDLYVTSVSLAATPISIDATHATAGCLASWFGFNLTGIASNQVIHNGATPTALGAGTLSFANSDANQNACMGATVSVALTSN